MDWRDLASWAVEIASLVGSDGRVLEPAMGELEEMARRHGRITEFGSVAFYSCVRSRSARRTVHVGSERVRQRGLTPEQREILENIERTMEALERYVRRAPFVEVRRRMGQNRVCSPRCTLYVSVARPDSVRLAHMWAKTLFPPEGGTGHGITLVDVPEWPEIQILVFPEVGVTFVLGSDYFGEVKKGFLRMAMWEAKQEGLLGLHAGAKIARARGPDGEIRRYLLLIFGLSGTGKTTHSCHDHFLRGPGEGIRVLQDDVVFLSKDGRVYGTEDAFYVKTEGLDPEGQPLLYRATTMPNVVLDNVMVDAEGRVDFLDYTLTSNGRAIVPRQNLGEHSTEEIDLEDPEEVDGIVLLFITRRNTVVPAMSKLTPEQAAAFFMLGESVITSAADPRRAGQSIRVVGTNPFIVGDYAYEGNWMYDFLLRNGDRVQAYLANTGGVGEIAEWDGSRRRVIRPVRRVKIEEMGRIIGGILRGQARWRPDPLLRVEVLNGVPGVSGEDLHPARYYDPETLRRMAEDLRRERLEWLSRFEGLRPEIVESI
ncbi:MAG: phosphoenolpyruvate carboxykinase (ATP) [Thermoproteota archaeon]|nr:MAG: phosphoenolpyruvate carboxykinase (ATP) [Candidatus Korarchaeota archaeon]